MADRTGNYQRNLGVKGLNMVAKRYIRNKKDKKIQKKTFVRAIQWCHSFICLKEIQSNIFCSFVDLNSADVVNLEIQKYKRKKRLNTVVRLKQTSLCISKV